MKDKRNKEIAVILETVRESAPYSKESGFISDTQKLYNKEANNKRRVICQDRHIVCLFACKNIDIKLKIYNT